MGFEVEEQRSLPTWFCYWADFTFLSPGIIQFLQMLQMVLMYIDHGETLLGLTLPPLISIHWEINQFFLYWCVIVNMQDMSK